MAEEYNYYPITVSTPQNSTEPSLNTPAVVQSDSNIIPAPNGTIMSGGTMQSPNFSHNNSGWRIDSNGNVEFGSGYFRGDITGASGTFSGALTGGSLNIPDLVAANSFHVDANGNTWWGAAAIGSAVAKILNTGVGTFSDINMSGGTIAGWTISPTALSTGAFDTLNTMYFGDLGLSLSDVFKVTSSGALTATSGTIGGFTLAGTNLYAGTGITRIVLDTGAGISLGASTFATSPFSVTLAGVLKAQSGTIGGFTITSTELYGGIIKTGATVASGSNGVIMDTAGLRGYDSVLGQTFNLPTDGSAPTFSSGIIHNTIFEIETSSIIRTSATVGDGSASSAGILINNTGLYATEANQTLANANVKILATGEATIKMNVKGGQTDYNTGTGYFLGLSGGDYKLSIGDPSGDHMNWDGSHLILRGSFDVGTGGIINNSVYTVANLPVSPTVVGFEVPSAYE